jgi:hypothetical protein
VPIERYLGQPVRPIDIYTLAVTVGLYNLGHPTDHIGLRPCRFVLFATTTLHLQLRFGKQVPLSFITLPFRILTAKFGSALSSCAILNQLRCLVHASRWFPYTK